MNAVLHGQYILLHELIHILFASNSSYVAVQNNYLYTLCNLICTVSSSSFFGNAMHHIIRRLHHIQVVTVIPKNITLLPKKMFLISITAWMPSSHLICSPFPQSPSSSDWHTFETGSFGRPPK